MNELYPLKFKPIFKEKIWGGNRIKEVFNLDYSPLSNCGEAWLVSGVEDEPSIVTNGFLADNELNELLEVYMTDLVGEKTYLKYKNRFPVLIKILDANDWLSVQVHPDDNLAEKRGELSGKTEMWYINRAEENASLICGFNRKLDKELYKKYLAKGKIKDIVNYVNVNTDDIIFLPAGRVHATGPGILLTEIQQTSDVTYRIYDWDRLDKEGNPRELHTEEALDAINFELKFDCKSKLIRRINRTVTMASCPYFTTNLIQIDEKFDRDYNILDSFVIFIGQKGTAQVEWEKGTETIKPGEAVLIPATITNLSLIPNGEAELLEVYIE